MGLVTAAGGCSTGSHVEPSRETQDPKHACYDKGNCSQYRQLPDGGSAAVDATDAGIVTMCGPCNG